MQGQGLSQGVAFRVHVLLTTTYPAIAGAFGLYAWLYDKNRPS